MHRTTFRTTHILRSFLPTQLSRFPTTHTTYLLTCLPTYLPTYKPTYRHTYVPPTNVCTCMCALLTSTLVVLMMTMVLRCYNNDDFCGDSFDTDGFDGALRFITPETWRSSLNPKPLIPSKPEPRVHLSPHGLASRSLRLCAFPAPGLRHDGEFLQGPKTAHNKAGIIPIKCLCLCAFLGP